MAKRFSKLDSLTHITNDEKEEISSHTISHPGLNELRKKIKDSMIPLLIQIFHLRQARQEQATQSRLQQTNDNSLEDIEKKLQSLQDDLKQLTHWCTSCLSQIERALGASDVKPRSPSSKKESSLKFSHLFSLPDTCETEASENLFSKFRKPPEEVQDKKKTSFRKLFSLAFRKPSQPKS